MRWLQNVLGTVGQARLTATETHIKALYDHVYQLNHELQQLRQDEARRAAEHAALVDSLTRLYKRVSMRIAREPLPHNGTTAPEETVMDMRRRLGR